MQNPGLDLVQWYAVEGRALPWRGTQDPYKVWLSEVILQQTRIDQGTSYYLRFVERFPTVHDLAATDTDTLMKLWEGLGYYSRARNLHETAKTIAHQLGGIFPNNHVELLKLKGIGPYTARAIASICFNDPVGVLDGNVFRVVSRYLGDPSPIDAPATRTKFQEIVDGWARTVTASDFNQAIMDLGAMVCTPRNPACDRCPLAAHCVAFAEGVQSQLPVKAKKLARRTVHYHFYLLGTAQGKLQVRKRPPTGIWPNLWEIPNEEVDVAVWNRAGLEGYELMGAFKHVFTHLDMLLKVYKAGGNQHADLPPGHREIALHEVRDYAFSRAVLKIFERYLPENA